LTTVRAPQQLPLALAHAPRYGREDFISGASNSAALRLIESWPNWPSPVVLVSGPTGSGKTHLAHIWAARAGARILEAGGLSIAMLPDIRAGGAVAIEDVDTGAVPEAALFHLINRIKELGAWLLLTACEPAEKWDVGLPDLRSRLRLAAPAALGAPDDELLRQVLVKLFADRQLVIDKPLIDYLIVRMERSLSFAVALVRALDSAALAAGRRVTRPMAAGVLDELSADEEEFADRQ
jgi:chromosomal replication initiation ATPase DnaA